MAEQSDKRTSSRKNFGVPPKRFGFDTENIPKRTEAPNATNIKQAHSSTHSQGRSSTRSVAHSSSRSSAHSKAFSRSSINTVHSIDRQKY